MYIFWLSERVKLNSCVVGIEEFDDHVKVRCVDGKEYKVCVPLLILRYRNYMHSYEINVIVIMIELFKT